MSISLYDNLKVCSASEDIANEEKRHNRGTHQLRHISVLLSAVSAAVVAAAVALLINCIGISGSKKAPAPNGVKQRVEAGAAPGEFEAQFLAKQVVRVQVGLFPVHVLRHEVRQQAGERQHGAAAVLDCANVHNAAAHRAARVAAGADMGVCVFLACQPFFRERRQKHPLEHASANLTKIGNKVRYYEHGKMKDMHGYDPRTPSGKMS